MVDSGSRAMSLDTSTDGESMKRMTATSSRDFQVRDGSIVNQTVYARLTATADGREDYDAYENRDEVIAGLAGEKLTEIVNAHLAAEAEKNPAENPAENPTPAENPRAEAKTGKGGKRSGK